jgi:hypothetical protein
MKLTLYISITSFSRTLEEVSTIYFPHSQIDHFVTKINFFHSATFVSLHAQRTSAGGIRMIPGNAYIPPRIQLYIKMQIVISLTNRLSKAIDSGN